MVVRLLLALLPAALVCCTLAALKLALDGSPHEIGLGFPLSTNRLHAAERSQRKRRPRPDPPSMSGGGAGLATTHPAGGRHDRLTTQRLAAWFGACWRALQG
jgi:hypothetical protein